MSDTYYEYILIEPQDDTGNNDGVLDRRTMTEQEAKIRNDEREALSNSRCWVKATSKPIKEEDL